MAQESLAAFKQVNLALGRQLDGTKNLQTRVESSQSLILRVSDDISGLVADVGRAAQRQTDSVKIVAELEQQAANIGDIVKAVARIADQERSG
ncbi:MAG: hypothetical protein ACUVQI_01190 [Thermochromatium sp.]